MLVEFVTSVTAGALGYAFREYRNRVTPLFQITRIDGDIRKQTTLVPMPKDINNVIDNKFYIDKLDLKPNLKNIYECWDSSDDLKQLWPQIKPEIEALRIANTEDAMTTALHKALRGKYFDLWLRRLFVGGHISIPPQINNQEPYKINVYDDDDQNGPVWIDFPTGAVSFGAKMKNLAIRAKCEPLLEAIRRLDLPVLHEVFRRYQEILDDAYTAALQVENPLKEILNSYSRWVFFCYIANTDKSPIIIENEAIVTIEDKATTKYREICYLALVKKDKAGEEFLADTNKPLVVRSESDEEFAIITRNTQSEMKLGAELRGIYTSKRANCCVSVKIRRKGLIKRQKFCSMPALFQQGV